MTHPKNEEWATGDEALDLKLSLNLNLCFEQLSSFFVFSMDLFIHSFI